MAGIIQAFDEKVRSMGKRFMTVLIPSYSSLVYLGEHGSWPYVTIIDRLRESGIQVLDFGRRLVEERDPDSLCALFVAPLPHCLGHFNEEGYAHLADRVFDSLSDEGLLPQADE